MLPGVRGHLLNWQIPLKGQHNILKQPHDGLLWKKVRAIKKYYDNLQLLVKKFVVHILSAPNQQETPQWTENYAHVIHGPTEHNQRVV